MLDIKDILGRWRIVDWVQRYEDGRLIYPLGKNLTGFVQYDADGAMFLAVAADNRPNFSTGGQWNAADSEKAAAYSTYLTYGGSYELSGDEVHHHIKISLYPGWAGAIQKRSIQVVDDQLELTTGLLEAGTPEARRAVLTWQRER